MQTRLSLPAEPLPVGCGRPPTASMRGTFLCRVASLCLQNFCSRAAADLPQSACGAPACAKPPVPACRIPASGLRQTSHSQYAGDLHVEMKEVMPHIPEFDQPTTKGVDPDPGDRASVSTANLAAVHSNP